MSINTLIDDSLANGNLFRLHPFDPFTKISRLIYLSRSVFDFVQSDEIRAGRLHADLDSFIAGDNITVSMIPRKAGNAYMGLLAPPQHGIWDIRSRAPKPGLRILGAFARRDFFIGLVLKTRKTLVDEREWNLAIAECNREWRKRFHSFLPLTGDNPNDYLTNCSCVD